jgi:NADPH:quinone reductase-like Zn-dependent oxidoreductase
MRAAVMRDRPLVVAEVPAPEPGLGEVLVEPLH